MTEKGDKRTLGIWEFEQTMTQHVEENVKHPFSLGEPHHQAFQLIQTVCEQKQVDVKA